MDIFEKCYAPSLAGELKEKGLYPYFHALQSRQDVEVMMEGKRRIMLGSNNYLGLTTDPEIIEAGIKALEQYGTGCSGSRFLNGTLEMHLALEDALARFLRKSGVVTFGTGFQSNVGIISALVGRHDYVICDRENHASIYAGCQLSYGKMLRYRHSDMADLEKCLQRVPETAGALVVTDGVFSMGGDIAKLPEICALAKKYGARVMVDDAHGLGVLGEGGRGTAAGGIAGLFTDPAMWKPQFLILRLCYTPYGIGLSAFAGVALLGRVIGKSRLREKLLSFLLLVFFCIPLFGYLLNGGLYSKDKVFIPFLPVLCAEVGLYVENQLVRKRECGKNRSTGNFKRKVMTELRELFPYLIVLILMWNAKQETYFEPYWHLGILDVICVTACYLAWRWFPAKKQLRGRELPFLPLVFSAVILLSLIHI